MSRYEFIDSERLAYPVRLLCQVVGGDALALLCLAPTGGHALTSAGRGRLGKSTGSNLWHPQALIRHPPPASRVAGPRLRRGVPAPAHGYASARAAGLAAPRLRAAPTCRAYVPRTTDSTHSLRCAPNRLLDQPVPTATTQVWVSDVTYLPLATGQWACLCAFQDAFTRQVVGWQVLGATPEELVLTALRRALLARQPDPGLVVHSDRGGQYCGKAYRALLHEHGWLARIAAGASATTTPRLKTG